MRWTRFGQLAMLVVLAAATPARSQGVAENLNELRLLVRQGDSIKVRDAQGGESRGRLVSISATALTLSVDSRRREWPAAEVERVWARRGDSLANGAYWGLGIGALVGGGAVAAVAHDDDEGPFIALAALIYGAIGTGIGVGVDALIVGEQVVFERPGRPSVSARVEPWVTPRVQGARLRVSF